MIPSLASVVGTALSIAFLWLLLERKHWRAFPYLAAYYLPMFIRASATAVFYWAGFSQETSGFYWWSVEVVTVLRFCVVWEVLRQAFPRHSPVRPVVRGVSLAVLAVFLAIFSWLGPEGNFFVDLERKLSLTTAAWLAMTLGVAAFYGVRLSRQVWAMAIGIGLLTATSLVNFSALELFSGFLKAWGFIRQWSFSLLMCIWIWGFWKPLPPPCEPDSSHLLKDTALRAYWARSWSAIRSIRPSDTQVPDETVEFPGTR